MYSIFSLNCRLKFFVSDEFHRLQCPILSTVGSVEEKWYLDILDKSSVSCPTCQAVGEEAYRDFRETRGKLQAG